MKGVTPILLSAFCVLAAFTFTSVQGATCSYFLTSAERALFYQNELLGYGGNFGNWYFRVNEMKMTASVRPTLSCQYLTTWGNWYLIRMTGGDVAITGRWYRQNGGQQGVHADMTARVRGTHMNIYATYSPRNGGIDVHFDNSFCYPSVVEVQVTSLPGGDAALQAAVTAGLETHIRQRIEYMMCDKMREVLKLI